MRGERRGERRSMYVALSSSEEGWNAGMIDRSEKDIVGCLDLPLRIGQMKIWDYLFLGSMVCLLVFHCFERS